MTILIGLGNPGKEYAKTKHNVGFLMAEEVCRVLSLPRSPQKFVERKKFKSEIADIVDAGGSKRDVMCVKPLTFMNESGTAVQMVVKNHNLDGFDQLYVCHDDLDIPLGSYKLQFGKGPKVHNGLSSIYESLGSKEFWHVRIGVDGRAGDRSIPGKDYVLQPFSLDEWQILQDVILAAGAELKLKILT